MSGDGRLRIGRAFDGVRRFVARTVAALAPRPDAPAPAAPASSHTPWAKLAPIGGRMSATESGFARAPPVAVPVAAAFSAPAPPAPEPTPSPVDTLADTSAAPCPCASAVALAKEMYYLCGAGLSLVRLMSKLRCHPDAVQAQLDKEVAAYRTYLLLKKAGVSVQEVVERASSQAEAVRQLALLVDELEQPEPEPVEPEPAEQDAVQAPREAGVPASDGTLEAAQKPEDASELVSDASLVQTRVEAEVLAELEDAAGPQSRSPFRIGQSAFNERRRFWETRIAAGSASSLVQTDSGAWDSASEDMQPVVGPPAVQALVEAGAGDDKLSVFSSEADSDTLRGRSSDDLSPSTPTSSAEEDMLMGLPNADAVEPHAGSSGVEEAGWSQGPRHPCPTPSLGKLSYLRRFGRSRGAQGAQ